MIRLFLFLFFSSVAIQLEGQDILKIINKDSPGATWDNLSLWADGENSYINSNGDEKGLHIKSNGGNKIILESSVGIGTSNPNRTLTVNGDIGTSGFLWQDGKTTWLMGAQANEYQTIVMSGWGVAHGDILWKGSEKTFTLSTGDGPGNMGAYGNANLVVTGNVGIGATNPQNKLEVNGTIRAKEIKVETGWADFVFHPSYQLKPLTEVEKFIKTNGHLEDIPSAEQVEKEGVNVGEMQKMLLQKVEELTLYVIEQAKEIKELKQENQILKERINTIL